MGKKQYTLRRAKAFFDLANPVLRTFFEQGYGLTEFCAGNGNAGTLFVEQGLVSRVTFVDVRRVRGLEGNLERLGDRAQLILGGVEDYEPVNNSVYIAVHACGELTDRIIEKAVQVKAPLAVMTCCHKFGLEERYSLKSPPDPRLMLYQNHREYIDKVRLQYLVEKRYDAQLLRIDSQITPHNNLLIGTPLLETI